MRRSHRLSWPAATYWSAWRPGRCCTSRSCTSARGAAGLDPLQPEAVLEESSERLGLLVDAFAVAADLAPYRLSLYLEPVDLGAIIADAAERSGPFVRARGQHLTVALPLEPLPVLA